MKLTDLSLPAPDDRAALDEATELRERALFEAKRVLVGRDLMIERRSLSRILSTP